MLREENSEKEGLSIIKSLPVRVWWGFLVTGVSESKKACNLVERVKRLQGTNAS